MGEKLNEGKQHRCTMEAEGLSGGNGTRVLEIRCIECFQRASIEIPAHLISDEILLKLVK